MGDTLNSTDLMRGAPPPADRQVTLANWRLPPFNRWGFQNVRQILPTAPISRGGAAALPLAADRHPIDGIAFAGPDGGEWTVARMLAETWTDGLVVLRGGRVVAEHYDNGQRPETPHLVFSVSKSFTGALAGIAAGSGQLDPDAPVTRYIPEATGSAYGDCAVRHVLDMTVGTSFEESYLDPAGDYVRYRVATGWNPPGDPSWIADMRGFLLTLKRDRKPHGETFHYVSPNSDLLGWILERATGERLADLMSRALWSRLGAESDAEITVDRLGAARTAGGISVTLRDLARLGETMRRGGKAGNAQVIPAAWVADILGKGDRAAWARGEMAELLPGGSYRSQWYSLNNASGAFCAIGIHGQWIYVDPAAEVVIAKQSSQPLPVDDATDHLLLRGFDAIARALAG